MGLYPKGFYFIQPPYQSITHLINTLEKLEAATDGQITNSAVSLEINVEMSATVTVCNSLMYRL